MNRGHAIVIGGGIVGLLTAHIASEHFGRVTILDRDRFPEQSGPRRGVPQGRYLHILMARGLRAFEEILPGISEQLSLAGAGILDFSADSALHFPAGWMKRFQSNIQFHACTRDLLEWTLRRRVMNNDRIQALEGHPVIGLTAEGREGVVTGVQLSNGSLEADVVIDASGRASRAPEWLRALGCSTVSETVVDAPIDYASRWYEIPDSFQSGWRLMAISPKYPAIPRCGTIYHVEGDRWNVLLLGLDGENVPVNEAGFLDFARSLATPAVYEAIRDARPLSPIYRYRNNLNRLRHYEHMDDLPQGFICMGDAVCALNPYAGLGMTSGALGALALREQLGRCAARDDWSKLTRDFQTRLATVNQLGWKIATNQHLRWPDNDRDSASLPRPPLHSYLGNLMRSAVQNPLLGKTVLEVMHMLKPPAALFTPEVQKLVATTTRRNDAETARGY